MQHQVERYPQLEVHLDKLRENLAALKQCCQRSCIDICGIVKAFHGKPEVAQLYEQAKLSSIGSSRLEQLKELKQAGFQTPMFLIRIPMASELREVVQWTEYSLQSEWSTLEQLNAITQEYQKIHQVVLMVDLGDLREGYWDWEELVQVACRVEAMPYVKLAGVGTNLGCYGTIQATPEKMEQLVQVAEQVEYAIGRKLDILSGGASTSIHMVLDGTMPKRINHLRLGECILLGGIWGCEMEFMHKDVFAFHTQVIESKVKPSYPVGELSVDAFGHVRTYVDRGNRRRALLAAGRADYGEPDDLLPREAGIKVLGASSDHTILDVHDAARTIEVGDVVSFDLCYATLVYLSNSRNVHWRFSDSDHTKVRE